MTAPGPSDVTRLLQAHHAGDPEAFGRLMPLVYERLRAIARSQLARGWPGRTLTTTGLVHEAYLDLVGETKVDWQSRSHFFAICALAMRRILVEYARRRSARKRGGGREAVPLECDARAVEQQTELVLAVDQALERLGALDERLGRLVECRFFAGMTEEETATALGVSLRTVERDWPRARAWLRKELGRSNGG